MRASTMDIHTSWTACQRLTNQQTEFHELLLQGMTNHIGMLPNRSSILCVSSATLVDVLSVSMYTYSS